MFFRLIRAIARPIVNFLFRVKIEDRDKLLSGEGLIICANHISGWDPIILGINIPQDIYFMAKQELFDVPLLGRILKHLNAFPVKRGAHDINAIKTAMTLTKTGKTLLMFPEGTRNPNDDPKITSKAGAVMIAARTDVRILPIAIKGPVKLFKKVIVRVGDPVYYPKAEYGHLDYDKYKELSNDLMKYIRELRDK